MRTSSGLNPKPRTIKSNENFDRISNCSTSISGNFLGAIFLLKGSTNVVLDF